MFKQTLQCSEGDPSWRVQTFPSLSRQPFVDKQSQTYHTHYVDFPLVSGQRQVFNQCRTEAQASEQLAPKSARLRAWNSPERRSSIASPRRRGTREKALVSRLRGNPANVHSLALRACVSRESNFKTCTLGCTIGPTPRSSARTWRSPLKFLAVGGRLASVMFPIYESVDTGNAICANNRITTPRPATGPPSAAIQYQGMGDVISIPSIVTPMTIWSHPKSQTRRQ